MVSSYAKGAEGLQQIRIIFVNPKSCSRSLHKLDGCSVIGASVLSDVRYVTAQLAKVLVSRSLFYEIPGKIKHLKPILIGYG
jgi:hypothetical protein